MNQSQKTRYFRTFAAWLQGPFTTLLHESTVVRYIGERKLFPRDWEGPAFFFQLENATGTPENLLGIQFDGTLLFALLDWLQGGDGTLGEESENPRELTGFEKRLAGRFLTQMERGIREVWNLEEKQQFIPVTGKSWTQKQRFTATEFQLNVSVLSGVFRLLTPDFSVEVPRPETSEEEPDVAESLASTPVRISVQITGSKIRPKDLMKWREGDVISLGRSEDFPFTVLVEGLEKFTAAPGRYKSRKALKIL